MMAFLRRPQIDPARYQVDARRGVAHLDGVPWTRAPVPPWLHRCWPQSGWGDMERCACGGLRMGLRVWIGRNTRREPAAAEAAAEERDDQMDALIAEYEGALPHRQQEIRAEMSALMDEADARDGRRRP
jgi:hypothetical protein